MTSSPAPWKTAGRYGKYSDEITDANGQAVAIVFTRKADPQTVTGILPNPQGQANASLIAAAPEMKATLQWLLDEAKGLDEHHRVMIRASIAKAEGR